MGLGKTGGRQWIGTGHSSRMGLLVDNFPSSCQATVENQLLRINSGGNIPLIPALGR